MKIEKEDIRKKIFRLIQKNYMLVAGMFASVFLLIAFMIFWQTAQISKMEDIIRDNTSSIIGLTDGGTVVEIQRTKLNADQQANMIAKVLKLLIVSRSELTKGFTVSQFNNPTDLIANSENLQEFFEYIQLQNPSVGKNISFTIKRDDNSFKEMTGDEISKESYGYFNAYLESLKTKLQSNQLPHFISINSTQIKNFETKDNTFQIDVEITVTLQNWVGKTQDGKNDYNSVIAKYDIKANGYFDLRLRTIDTASNDPKSPFHGYNKLGLHFDQINISMPNS